MPSPKSRMLMGQKALFMKPCGNSLLRHNQYLNHKSSHQRAPTVPVICFWEIRGIFPEHMTSAPVDFLLTRNPSECSLVMLSSNMLAIHDMQLIYGYISICMVYIYRKGMYRLSNTAAVASVHSSQMECDQFCDTSLSWGQEPHRRAGNGFKQPH